MIWRAKTRARVARQTAAIAGALLLWGAGAARAQWLFDATKAEMAGNADWVVDADQRNLNVTSGNGSGTVISGTGDSNPQRVPTPITGITASTPENYWTGALSAWGTSLIGRNIANNPRAGFAAVESLPYNGAITYGVASNPQDLSNYKVYAVVEPNILFTATQKTAILSFVQNGGSLFMVADHTGSDRNNDGSDAVAVWNDLFSSNSVQTNPFGFRFNNDDVTPSSASLDTSAGDPITNGPYSTAAGFSYNQGATLTLTGRTGGVGYGASGAVWTTTSHTSSNVMVAYGTFGAGRWVAVGDSSPFDDGTGDPNDALFPGWSDRSNGNLILNASVFLQAGGGAAIPEPPSGWLLAAGGWFVFGRRFGAGLKQAFERGAWFGLARRGWVQ